MSPVCICGHIHGVHDSMITGPLDENGEATFRLGCSRCDCGGMNPAGPGAEVETLRKMAEALVGLSAMDGRLLQVIDRIARTVDHIDHRLGMVERREFDR